jgi:hypothetical protein
MSETASTIHDLGYKRYLGTRRPPSTRWRVITRHQVASGWKGWWRYKIWLIAAVIATVIAAVFIFVASNKTLEIGRNLQSTFADFALPLSITLCNKIAFIISLTIGAGVIAGDMQSGAFIFYFARSTRPRDYLLGKLAGYGLLVAIPTIGGPFLVACMRIGFASYDGAADIVPHLWLLPKVLAIGALSTLVYTAVPLGFSAMVSNRRYALGMWAGYYMIAGGMFVGMGMKSGIPLGALDLANALSSFSAHLLDSPIRNERAMVGMAPALISIVGQVALSIGLIWYQLTNAQKAGVGGAT